MLPFTLENLSKVNRVLARYKDQQYAVKDDGSTVHLFEIYLSFYIDSRQVAVGAPRQEHARNGEFTTDRSGLRLALKFLEQISGMNFKSQPCYGQGEEYHRNDLTVVPFANKEGHDRMEY